MKKKLGYRCWLLIFLLLSTSVLWAQESIQIGKYRVELPDNVQHAIRGYKTLELGASHGGAHNVLVQFVTIPTTSERELFASKGLELGDYLGNRAYLATVRKGVNVRKSFKGTTLRTMLNLAAEWKLSELLTSTKIPDWTRTSSQDVRIDIAVAPNVTEQEARAALELLGAKSIRMEVAYSYIGCEVAIAKLMQLASLPWVLSVSPTGAPKQLMNHTGQSLSRGNLLGVPTALGGRGLDGSGMRIGIWDGNVVYSPDFGSRVTRMEYQLSAGGGDSHGTHVAGTMVSSGMSDPATQGLAPKAHLWSWNFAQSTSERLNAVEMEALHKAEGVTLSNNSYGLPLNLMCNIYFGFAYNVLSKDAIMDAMIRRNPTYLPIFAAGNEQTGCKDSVVKHYGLPKYGTMGDRTKNAMMIGAVDEIGRMAPFSSWGPLDDGRLGPHVMAKGFKVTSTNMFGGTNTLSGTSMASPTATGHLTLVSQRYKQLHNGQDIRGDLLKALAMNTATDLAPAGPDFSNGYGLLNAEKMVVTLEKGWHTYHKGLKNGEEYSYEIPVPQGAKEARVMIVWNDTVSAKIYKWGQRALINDLDLSVDNTKPWVCNPAYGKVQEPAVRGEDHVNNAEQVTFKGNELTGKTKLTVKVVGKEIPAGKQDFQLVWWFEIPGRMRFTAPVATDIYTPGEKILSHIEDYGSRWTGERKVPSHIAISYDGAKTFVNEVDYPDSYAFMAYDIPKDAPTTTKAVLRLRDVDGNVAYSEPFTVAPIPTELTLNTGVDPCGKNMYELSWVPPYLGKTDNGYVILLGNVETEEWQVLKEVGKDVEKDLGKDGKIARVDIKSELLAQFGDHKNLVVAVAVKIANGKWGRRTRSLALKAFQSLKLSPATIPFAENFASYPSPYYEVFRGVRRSISLNAYSDKDVPQGSNVLQSDVIAFNEVEFDPKQKPFAEANKAFHFELRFCDVDFSAFQPNTKLVLRMRGAMTSVKAEKPETSVFRLLMDGNPIPDVRGNLIQKGKDTDFEWVYPITVKQAGEKHTFRLQHEGQGYEGNLVDRIFFTGLYFEKPSEGHDVGIAFYRIPVDGANLGVKDFYLTFVNGSVNEERDLELNAYVNDVWRASKKITIHPYDDGQFPFALDLSTDKPEGESLKIRFEIKCPGDIYLADNVIETEVKNFGDVLPHPKSFYRPDSQLPQDPKLRYTIGKKKRIYTDNGGLLGDYDEDEDATVIFEPEDPSMRVCVKFLKFKTKERGGILDVYTALNAWDELGNNLPYQQLDGEITDAELENLTFVSGASDGSLRFHFRSDNSLDALDEGWMAEVYLVPEANPLSLLQASAELVGREPVGDIPLKITLRNNTKNIFPRAHIRSSIGGKFPAQEVIGNIAPQQTQEVELKDKIAKVSMRTAEKLRVEVLAQDADMSDNLKDIWMVYDRYAIPHWKTGVDRSIIFLPEEAIGADGKPFSKRLTVYREDKTPAKLDCSEVEVGEENPYISFKIYADWNDDGEFDEATEKVFYSRVNMLKNSAQTNTLDYTIAPPSSVQAGRYRMRAIYSPNNNDVQSALGNPNGISGYGYVKDYVLDVKDGHHPDAGDLALTYVGLSNPSNAKALVGTDFSKTEELWIEVTNVSPFAFKGDFDVTYKVGGQTYTETFTITKSLAEWSGHQAFKLEKTADLSPVGEHIIEATIKEKTLGKEENNSRTIAVYMMQPQVATSGEWVLNSKEYLLANDPKTKHYDEVNIPAQELWNKAVKSNNIGNFSFEFWFKLAKPQYGVLLSTSGFSIATTLNMRAEAVLDNGLFLTVGKKKAVYTRNANADLLKPNQWYHLAVSVTQNKKAGFLGVGESVVKAWLNGVPLDLVSDQVDGADMTGDVDLLKSFQGQMDEFRMWSKELTAEQIKKFMYKHVTTDGTTEDKSGLIAEFPFNEGTGYMLSFNAVKGNNGKPASSALLATLPSRIKATEGETAVWRKTESELITGAHFKDQVLQTYDAANKVYNLTFSENANIAEIAGAKFATVWPNTEITHNGATVSESTKFDFSGGKEVIVKAQLKLFGTTLTQEVKFKGVKELSSDCTLYTVELPKAKNAGLLAEVSETVTGSVVMLKIQPSQGKIDEPSKVKLTFTIPSGAHVYLIDPKGVKKLLTADTEVDLTTPRVIEVVAANKRTSRVYTIALQQSQELQWTAPTDTYVYGTEPVDLHFVSTTLSINPVVATSTKPNVATVSGGKLIFGAIGTTTIKAKLEAGNSYAQSAELSKEITVTPRTVKETPKFEKVVFGERLPNSFVYEGLIEPNHKAQMPRNPFTHGDYKVMQGSTEFPSNSVLERGKYKLVNAKGTGYQLGFYTVVPQEKEFEVVQGEKWKVALQVTNENTPVAGASVVLDGKEYTTNSEGRLVMLMQQEQEYSYVVTKDGYARRIGSFKLERADKEVKIELQKAQYFVEYEATEGGKIFGNTKQALPVGTKGAPVFAQADPSYFFAGWSDGMKDNPRVDQGAAQSQKIKAMFEREKFELLYTAGEHGTLTGELKQTVVYGGSATKVTATAKDGYYFVAWSDGETSAERIDVGVKENIKVQALFRKMLTLPYTCNFEDAVLPDTWATTTRGRHAQEWHISKTPRPVTGDKLDNYFVVVDADKDINADFEAILYTPRFDLSGVQFEHPVDFAFDLLFRDVRDELAKLYMEYNVGEGWKPLGTASGKLSSQSSARWVAATLEKGELNGKPYIQYRLRYVAQWGYWALIDNVAIYEQGANVLTPINLTFRVNPDGAGKIIKRRPGREDDITNKIESCPRGVAPAPFEAIANEGYKFVRWKDGVTTAYRTALPVMEDQEFEAEFVSAEKIHLRYESTVPQATRFKVGDVYATDQWLEAGAMSSPVAIEVAKGYIFKYWLPDETLDPILPAAAAERDIVYKAVVVPTTLLTEAKLSFTFTPTNAGHVELSRRSGEKLEAGSPVYIGDRIVVNFVPKPGFALLSVVRKSDKKEIQTFRGKTQLILGSEQEFEVTFTPVAQIVTKIEPEGSAVVKYKTLDDKEISIEETPLEFEIGKTIVMEIHPETGWKFDKLVSEGKTLRVKNNEYTLTLQASQEFVLSMQKDGAGISEIEDLDVTLAPNPASEFVVLHGIALGDRVHLLSLEGKEFFAGEVRESKFVIELGSLPSGMYLVRVERHGIANTLRFVKR